MKLMNELFEIKELKNIGLAGMTDESFCLYVNEVFNVKNKGIIILVPSIYEANQLYNILNAYNDNVLLFPMDEFLTSMAISISPDFLVNRLEVLNELINNSKKIVIAHLMSYLHFLPNEKLYKKHVLCLKTGTSYKIENIMNHLINMGYHRETMVNKTGDIAVRGFIVDIFPISENHPVRIEFFDDEIESIRYFDEDTQKSIASLPQVTISPASEFLLEKYDQDKEYNAKHYDLYGQNLSSIKDYMPESIFFIKDYDQLKNMYLQIEREVQEYKCEKDNDYKGNYMFDFNIIEPKLAIHYLYNSNLVHHTKLDKIYQYSIKELPSFKENIDAINAYLHKMINKTVIIGLKDYQISNFTKYLNVPYVIANINDIKEHKINFVNVLFGGGFLYNDYVILTEKELFNTHEYPKKYKTKFKYSTKIKNIDSLNIGDYIVHSLCGIGIYNGIKTLEMHNIKKDYLELIYKNNDKLYVPVEKIDVISKFSGKEGLAPSISSLGSQEWQKTKKRVTDKVRDIANELLKIYAERKSQKGYKFAKDDELQIMFENEFSFQPTNDQLTAVEQIKWDMESSQPMDRLLCGDVGFGKTEVAFRAMFKAVMNSKQVLYLCPTTILSMQHYNNAKVRFKDFPVNIALLNRFVSLKETTKIIEGLKKGSIDIVIGTHRLLSKDIEPKDLGLLVIDEEQRFGVKHKEAIKKYKANVDVLTLTATPIPRTLQMSLIGIRSLSLITTPPVNRFPVQTYVLEENKQIMKDAIYKELSRQGQVFILYNHVEDIEHKVYEIQALVPEARIIYAHGRMEKNDLENKMIDFVQGKADILVCTTIIETGIDIPNVNTLIILEADHFGLSQLYQLRGRVGRSDKIAYAYMMYKSGKVLGEIAVKRLKVIQEFTELGSGYAIANRDLSIRGAGNILGSEQAGFIDSIGIDLYLKILNEEVERLKGEEVLKEEPEEKALINVSTHISDKYVQESSLKIEIHKLINTIDSYDKLIEVKKELEDRFGKINGDMKIYMYEEWFEKLAKKVDVIKVNQHNNIIELIFSANKTKEINMEQLFLDSYQISKEFKFAYKNECLTIIFDISHLEKHYVYYLIDLLTLIDKNNHNL